MSILENVKLLGKPISELAKLPQDTIMQMAQSGHIPVEYVAPIISKKASLADAEANMEAMLKQSQMPPGTVLEGILAKNAANEVQQGSPQMPPQQMAMAPQMSPQPQMPENTGIGALPVSEQAVPEYADGGIVAFSTGGQPQDDFDYAGAARDIDSNNPPSYSGMYTGLGDEARAIAEARAAFLGPNNTVADLLEYYKGAEKRAAEQSDKNFNLRLLQAGLGTMGGESPHFFTNLSKGTQPAVAGFMEDIAKQSAASEARRKAMAELKGADRAEQEKVFGQAIEARKSIYDVEQRKGTADADRESRERVAQKDRDSRERVANASPDAIRGAKAIQQPGESLGAALARYTDATVIKDQYNAAAGLVQAAYTGASKEYTATLGPGGANFDIARAAAGNKDILKSLKLTQEQAVAELARRKKKIFDEAYEGIGMSPEVASRYLRDRGASGTKNTTGFSVTAPDGKTYTFPTKDKADEFERAIAGKK